MNAFVTIPATHALRLQPRKLTISPCRAKHIRTPTKAVSSGRAVPNDANSTNLNPSKQHPPPSQREKDVLDALRPTAQEISTTASTSSNPSISSPNIQTKQVSTTTTTTTISTTVDTNLNTSIDSFDSNSIPIDSNFITDVQIDSDQNQNDIFLDGEQVMDSWARKGRLSAILRTLEIWVFFFRMVFAEVRIRKMKDPIQVAETRRIQALKLKLGLLRLGPTFIKIGQLLSTRVDIVPKEYIDELSVLQDRVPGFSGERAIQVIESEFSTSLYDIFDEFDPTPIAAASLGQVHKAVLDGQEVAVKIQRAGLRELFDVDLKNLKLLAVMLDKLDTKADGASRNWVQIYDESAKLLYEEIDYVQEGRNADRFRDNFADIPWVKVPGIYWDLTSSKVLTMEYVPGIKINDYEAIEKAGIDRKLLAERSAQSYLMQLLRHGYFHTDPHCGNLAVDTVANGRLIYYDFGMMSTFEPNIKKGLVDVIFGIYEGSAKEICDAMTTMGVLSNSADRITVEKVGRYFLGLFRTNLGNENRSKTKEEKRAEMTKRFESIGEDLIAVSEDSCFNFPPVFTFVFRSFTTLEGIGKGLNPKYDLTMIAGPYLRELIDLKDGSAAVTAVKSFRKRVGWRNEDFSALVTQPRKTAYIENTLRRMESGDLRLRVRVLESERAFKRVTLMQTNMALAMAATTLSNMALVLTTAAERFAIQARLLWILAAIVSFKLIIGLLKYRSLDARLRKYVKNGN